MSLDDMTVENWVHYVRMGEMAACLVMQNCVESIEIAMGMHEDLAAEVAAYPWVVVTVSPPAHSSLLPGYTDDMNKFGQTPIGFIGCQDVEEAIEEMRLIRRGCNARKLPMAFFLYMDQDREGFSALAERMGEEANTSLAA